MMQCTWRMRHHWHPHVAIMAATCVVSAVNWKKRKVVVGEAAVNNSNPLLDELSVVSYPRFDDVKPHHVKIATDHQLQNLSHNFNILVQDIQ